MKKHSRLLPIFCLLFFSINFLNAQKIREDLLEDINKYFSIKKEVAYLHLNKSILLQGEQLGFSAYILDKTDLTPSDSSANLYVQIRNLENEIIQEELLQVENGVATGVINIDKEFHPGDYTISAFTNWMRNFEERNYFSETIKVLATNLDITSPPNDAPDVIDAQFLPESGHLLNGIINNVGVVVKDGNGYGLSNAKIIIKKNGDQTIGNLSLNEMGIGKFAFIPQLDENYNAVITYGGKSFPVDMALKIVEEGIILSANQRDDILDLLVQTLPHQQENLRNKSFVFLVQGRKSLEAHSFEFDNRHIIPFKLDMKKLDPGVNIITIFDETRRPVAERLFFNYTNLPIEGLREAKITQHKDSLKITLSFGETATRTLSVSVLPKTTVSANRHHNIVSYHLLQPYLRGVVENAGWYFDDVDERKKYHLDNLLLTQGWSSYDWVDIFQNGLSLNHQYEKGFEILAKINNVGLARNDLRFLVHATSNNPILFVDVPKNTEEFIIDGVIPAEGEAIAISRLKHNDKLVPANLYIKSFPNHIPNFIVKQDGLKQRLQLSGAEGKIFKSAFADEFLEGSENLGEVLVTAFIDKEKERERRLDLKSWGEVSVITERDLKKFYSLADFLRSKRFTVTEEMGTISIKQSSKVPTRLFNTESEAEASSDPLENIAIYLDDLYIADHAIFYNYPLSTIDYIEINRRGMAGGPRDTHGIIKIYSDFTGKHVKNIDHNRIQKFELPLSYAGHKTYYTPKYENINDNFFQRFGVIDWKSNMRFGNGEDIVFQISKPEVDFKLIIEGIAEDGTLIHEVKTFSIAE